MTWNRLDAIEALAAVLQPVVDAGATVLPAPPGSFNPPAVLMQYPTTVTLHSPTFAIDTVDWTVTVVVGLHDGDTLDELLNAVTDLVEADQTLGRVVQVCQPTEWRSWRILNVSGADYLAADLVLNTRM